MYDHIILYHTNQITYIINNFSFPRNNLVCPPAPVKRRPRPTIRPRFNLQEEPACARSINLQDHCNPLGPVRRCPGAPSKSRASAAQILAPKRSALSKNVRLSANKGILPRPFQSRARRNIMRQLRTYRNMVRIMGVEDPAQNWINLDTIHSVPLNRAGNPAPPPTPRKSRKEMSLNFQRLARQMPPRMLDFDTDSSDSEDDANDSGYGGRPRFLAMH